MRAMLLEAPGRPLRLADLPIPTPAPNQLLLQVRACAVCRTDLHVLDGEVREPKLPLIPGHQIVGEVVQVGAEVEEIATGTRVGVPWLGWTCGVCRYCTRGRENLCDRARFTGYQLDGGLPSTPLLTRASASPFPRATLTCRRRRCAAPG